MTTKQLYKILDKEISAPYSYNLKKIRNIGGWRVSVFKGNNFHTWVCKELYPDYYDIKTIINEFKNLIKAY